MVNAALPDMRRQLVRARDEHLAQVVALVDALPQRGQADALIAPLRPRLALLAPVRPLTALRLMFSPLDPVIVAGPRWRPGMPAVPRTALGCLGAAVMPRLPAAVLPAGMAAGLSSDIAARAGAALWPAAAAVLDALPLPGDWESATGLPPACFGLVRASIAAVLHQAVRLGQLMAMDTVPGLGSAIQAIIIDVQARNPDGLTVVLTVLLSHGPAAAALARSGFGALAPATLDVAVEQSLDRADHLMQAVMPSVGLQAAIGHLEDVAALIAVAEHPACRLALRIQAGRMRQAADQACRDRLSQAVQQDLLPRLAGTAQDAPLDDAAVEELESAARGMRRLVRAGRQFGPGGACDAVLARVAMDFGALSAPGLTRMDRLRLAELLVGAEAALRLVPDDDPP